MTSPANKPKKPTIATLPMPISTLKLEYFSLSTRSLGRSIHFGLLSFSLIEADWRTVLEADWRTVLGLLECEEGTENAEDKLKRWSAERRNTANDLSCIIFTDNICAGIYANIRDCSYWLT
jgi:hypothetical protein